MKYWSAILSVYFLLLAVMPCGDAFAHHQDEPCMEQVCHSHYQADDSDHPEADACSPLCMCNCCGGVTLLCSALTTNEVLAPFSLTSTAYSKQIPSEISFSIWQPPKLG